VIEQLRPVRRDVVVRASQEAAFEMFTSGIDRWWPRGHHIGDADVAEVVIEPGDGGRWYARHVDGTETSSGYVIAWEPYDRVVLAWQIDGDWQYDPTLVTHVEVRFVAEAPDRTRVELEHSRLERFGPAAQKMRDTFEQPGAWEGVLAAFAAVVDAV
jgi:Activator of Hsp90 ATPase homolog 1-like protein